MCSCYSTKEAEKPIPEAWRPLFVVLYLFSSSFLFGLFGSSFFDSATHIHTVTHTSHVHTNPSLLHRS